MLCPKLLIGGATVEIHFVIIVPIVGTNNAHLQKHVSVKLGNEK
jgi:hypothetical protein